MPRSKQVSEQMRSAARAQIVAAARKLFSGPGYFRCRVSDVAREAGMSSGNVYWYFASKEQLLKAVLEEGLAAQEAVLADAASHPGSGREKLVWLVDRYLALCQEQSDFFDIMTSILGHGGASFFQSLGIDLVQIGARYHRYLKAVIVQAQAEGALGNRDPEVLATFFYSFFNGLRLTYGDAGLALPPQAIADAVLRLLGSSAESGV